MLTVLMHAHLVSSVSSVSSMGVTRVLRTCYYAHCTYAFRQREQGKQYKDYSLTAYLLVPCNGNRNTSSPPQVFVLKNSNHLHACLPCSKESELLPPPSQLTSKARAFRNSNVSLQAMREGLQRVSRQTQLRQVCFIRKTWKIL